MVEATSIKWAVESFVQMRVAPACCDMPTTAPGDATGMATVRATMPNTDEVLWPGTLVTAQMAKLVLDAGFSDVSVEVHTLVFTDQAMLPVPVAHATAARQAGAITGDEADKWIGEQTRRAREDRLLVAIPMFLAAGTR